MDPEARIFYIGSDPTTEIKEFCTEKSIGITYREKIKTVVQEELM